MERDCKAKEKEQLKNGVKKVKKEKWSKNQI